MRRPGGRCIPARRRLARPLDTAFGRLRRRDGWWLVVQGAGSQRGLGEAAPLPGMGTGSLARSAGELARWLRSGRARGGLEGAAPIVRFAIDTALADLHARQRGVSMAAWLGRGHAPRSSVRTNALLVAGEPEALEREVAAAVARGEHTLKLKLGQSDLACDLDRLSAARSAAGAGVALRGDANGAWDEAEAERRLQAFKPFELAYVEQPVPAGELGALARLRRRTEVPVAADEAVQGPASLEAVLRAEAADVVVLKPALLGGFEAALGCAARCADADVPVVLTSLLDGAVARAAVLHLAASLSPEPLACGLAPTPGLCGDRGRLAAPRGGRLALPPGPGLGVELVS